MRPLHSSRSPLSFTYSKSCVKRPSQFPPGPPSCAGPRPASADSWERAQRSKRGGEWMIAEMLQGFVNEQWNAVGSRGSLLRDLIQRVVGDVVQERLAVAVAHAGEVKLMHVTAHELVHDKAHGKSVGTYIRR